jgi:hypothetical protein
MTSGFGVIFDAGNAGGGSWRSALARWRRSSAANAVSFSMCFRISAIVRPIAIG